MTMSERRAESIEDCIWYYFETQIKSLESLARDKKRHNDWLRPHLQTALQNLANDLDRAAIKFELSLRPASGETDGGPTPADIAGEGATPPVPTE
jgi:hypothetical protein